MAASSLPPLACRGVSFALSGLHAQTERTRKHKEKRKLLPVEAQTKTQNRRVVLRHGGAPLAPR